MTDEFYLAMYFYSTLMERKGWTEAPKFFELDEDEKQDWLTIASIIMDVNCWKQVMQGCSGTCGEVARWVT